MERLFYQREWQNIQFRDLPGVNRSSLAGPEFYSAFYETLLSRGTPLSPSWIEQKRKIGEWLAAEFLAKPARSSTVRVFSVGAGLGVVEGYLWSKGYRVDVLECEAHSLRALRSHCPEAAAIIGDARRIPCRSGMYDLVYMSGVDYCFDRDEYALVLREMRRLTTSNGKVASVCISNLSVVGMMRRTVKAMLKQEGGEADVQSGEIPWGYQRTVAEHLSAGRRAGLFCDGVYLFDQGFNVRSVRSPASVSVSSPTLRECIVGIAFRREKAR